MATISTQPQTLDITHYRGDDFVLDCKIVDGSNNAIDMTGYTIRMQVRKASKLGPIVWEWDSSLGIGDLTIASNTLVFKLSRLETDTYPFSGYFDIEWTTPTGVRETWVAGKFDLTEDVSK